MHMQIDYISGSQPFLSCVPLCKTSCPNPYSVSWEFAIPAEEIDSLRPKVAKRLDKTFSLYHDLLRFIVTPLDRAQMLLGTYSSKN